jgi:hypothetical protein
MLSKNQDRVLSYCALDYEPRLGSGFASAADVICRELNPNRIVNASVLSYTFQWPAECFAITLGAQRLMWQTLGLGPWQKELVKRIDTTREILRALGVQQFKRIGFKVTAYLPLGMTHAEMCQLMFGSFLVGVDELKEVCDPPYDTCLQIEGDQQGMHYILNAGPLTTKQAGETFGQVGNFGPFLKNKLSERATLEFYDRVTESDVFLFDIDLSRTDCPADQLECFLTQSLETAGKIANRCVDRLQSKPIKRGE